MHNSQSKTVSAIILKFLSDTHIRTIKVDHFEGLVNSYSF